MSRGEFGTLKKKNYWSQRKFYLADAKNKGIIWEKSMYMSRKVSMTKTKSETALWVRSVNFNQGRGGVIGTEGRNTSMKTDWKNSRWKILEFKPERLRAFKKIPGKKRPKFLLFQGKVRIFCFFAKKESVFAILIVFCKRV